MGLLNREEAVPTSVKDGILDKMLKTTLPYPIQPPAETCQLLNPQLPNGSRNSDTTPVTDTEAGFF